MANEQLLRANLLNVEGVVEQRRGGEVGLDKVLDEGDAHVGVVDLEGQEGIISRRVPRARESVALELCDIFT